MSDLSFAQPARRNLFVPIALALAVLGLAAFLILRFTPHDTAKVTITGTDVLPIQTVFKSTSKAIGTQTEDDLYVFATVRIEDHLRLPLILKDFTAALLTPANEELTVNAVEKPDLADLLATFPQLKSHASSPLYRETRIEPGTTAEGKVVLHFLLPKQTWDERKSVSLKIVFYSQSPITVEIPK